MTAGEGIAVRDQGLFSIAKRALDHARYQYQICPFMQPKGEKLPTKKQVYVKPELILLAGVDGQGTAPFRVGTPNAKSTNNTEGSSAVGVFPHFGPS